MFLAASPYSSHRALALSISFVVMVMILATVVAKFKIDITLFLRDTLGCHSSISGTLLLLTNSNYINCMLACCDDSCCFLLRWKESRRLFDVLQEWHGGGTERAWETVAEECFGGDVWLHTLSLWTWRPTRERYEFEKKGNNMHLKVLLK